MDDEKFKNLEDRISLLEFKIQLLADNTKVNRLLFEYNITHDQYVKIMDVMDKLRDDIENGNKKEVSISFFENTIMDIIDKREDVDYHFCESLAQAFMEDGRWEEVFPALYGHMEKYKYYLQKREKERQE